MTGPEHLTPGSPLPHLSILAPGDVLALHQVLAVCAAVAIAIALAAPGATAVAEAAAITTRDKLTYASASAKCTMRSDH